MYLGRDAIETGNTMGINNDIRCRPDRSITLRVRSTVVHSYEMYNAAGRPRPSNSWTSFEIFEKPFRADANGPQIIMLANITRRSKDVWARLCRASGSFEPVAVRNDALDRVGPLPHSSRPNQDQMWGKTTGAVPKVAYVHALGPSSSVE